MKASSSCSEIEIFWDQRQCSLVLVTLGRRPFAEVYELIGKLSAKRGFASGIKQSYLLERRDLKICLEAFRVTPDQEHLDLVLDLRDQLKNCGLLGDVCV